jgi:hypothetical protein
LSLILLPEERERRRQARIRAARERPHSPPGPRDSVGDAACVTNVWTGETATIDDCGRFENSSIVYRAEDRYGRMIAPPPDYWDEVVRLPAPACPCGRCDPALPEFLRCNSPARPDFASPEQMEAYTKQYERNKRWKRRRERIWHPIRRFFRSAGKFMSRCLTACSMGRRRTPGSRSAS